MLDTSTDVGTEVSPQKLVVFSFEKYRSIHKIHSYFWPINLQYQQKRWRKKIMKKKSFLQQSYFYASLLFLNITDTRTTTPIHFRTTLSFYPPWKHQKTFLYLQKTSEKLSFSDFFRGCWKVLFYIFHDFEQVFDHFTI